MATTPQGDDIDVRRSVMGALARAVARQRMAMTGTRSVKGTKPKSLAATYSLSSAPRAMTR